MRLLRIVLGGYFVFFSAWSIVAAFLSIARINHIHDTLWILLSISMAAFFSVTGAILGLAWWSNWREWESARAWGIAASLLSLLTMIGAPIFYLIASGWDAFLRLERLLWIPTIIGTAVLIVVSLPAGGPLISQVARSSTAKNRHES